MKPKNIMGIALIVIGIVLGLYVGIWVCFIGGIVGIVEAVRAPQIVPLDVALNVAKTLFSGVCGWLSAACLILPGWLMCNHD